MEKIYEKGFYFGWVNWHGEIQPQAWDANSTYPPQTQHKTPITESEFNEPLGCLEIRYAHLRPDKSRD